MNIAVCAKCVPVSSVVIQIDPSTKRVVRDNVPQELDPAAASGVEEALRLAEKNEGTTVTVVTMGRPNAVDEIRKALAMGADRAILISDEALAGSDTLGTAKALAAAMKKEQFDLVICATESTDTYSGLVPGQLAELLGLAPLTFAKELSVEGETVKIRRQTEFGYQVVEAQLPALVSVSSGINEPRYPTLKGIMGAKRKEVLNYTAADLGLGPADAGESGARERVLAVATPPSRAQGEIVTDEGDGGKRIADFLASLKVI
ncbi:MAG: electron transfer flavoprotein subunit beta/FixA family protein [Chloroflexota bacterium]|nr:electron transfer flavoprotein subunit beta/FixA family protein [Chloroflexota bacterium]